MRSRWLTLGVALLLAGCAPAPAAVPTSSVGSGANRWVAYQHLSDSGSPELRLVHPDGSDDHPLIAEPPGETTHPDWSPDGSRIAFTVDDSQLWTVNVDGSGLVQLPVECDPNCYLLDSAAWSPDGDSIAYMHTRQHLSDVPATTIESVEIATGAVTILWTAAEPLDIPSILRWAPDGTELVTDLFRYPTTTSSVAIGSALAVIDLAHPDAAPKVLTDWDMFAAYPDWSPDGERIVFSTIDLGARDFGGISDLSPPSDLYTIAPDGSDLTQLTHNPSGDSLIRNATASGPLSSQPTWSPDGKSIAFVQTDGDVWPGWGMALIDATGGATRPLVGDGYADGTHPRLSPAK